MIHASTTETSSAFLLILLGPYQKGKFRPSTSLRLRTRTHAFVTQTLGSSLIPFPSYTRQPAQENLRRMSHPYRRFNQLNTPKQWCSGARKQGLLNVFQNMFEKIATTSTTNRTRRCCEREKDMTNEETANLKAGKKMKIIHRHLRRLPPQLPSTWPGLLDAKKERRLQSLGVCQCCCLVRPSGRLV